MGYFRILYTDSSSVIDCVVVLYKFFWMVMVMLGFALLNGLNLAYNVQRESAAKVSVLYFLT